MEIGKEIESEVGSDWKHSFAVKVSPENGEGLP